ncbi:PAS domain S-box protein [Haloarcula nitratireducens]|uniref:histidine kinase n=1 Tax=Haloarcula nitratireducens TaxID=2487749 RepID=A0AAW4PHZ6_9EURY|nr:PAS domain S-box protein [Halomicroarcula nitratireducens]MBX0297253.1 PAS domain S-box protein [Halomicroarcula nitratireducens]
MCSDRIPLTAVIDAYESMGSAHEPVTARELSAELGCARRTAYKKLDELAERGDLQTKKVGARGRVWWRPADHDRADVPAADTDASLGDGPEAMPASTDDTKHEQPLSTLLGTLPGMVYRCRNERGWPMEFVSDGCYELTGYEPHALERGEVSYGDDIVVDADRTALWTDIQTSLDNQEQCVVTYRIETASGDVRWVRERVRGVYTATGEVDTLEGIIIDITEHKEREQQLWQHQEYTDAVVDAIDDIFYILDESGELQRWNQSLCEVTGYSTDEIESMHTLEFFADAAHDTITDGIREGFETGYTQVEVDLVTKDGDRIPYEFVASTLDDPDGNRMLAGIGRDITDQKERERELKRTERQFEAAFNNPSSFMGLLDPDGTVRRINQTALDFADIDEKTVRGEQFWETPWFTHSEEVQAELQDGIARAANGEYVRAEIPHQSADGDIAVIDAMLEPVRDDEDVVAIVPSGHDITEQKEYEQQLEEQNERLEGFASMLAHELRNPVTIGQIYSQQLPADADGEALEHITEAFHRIEEMIDVMLVVARNEEAVGERSRVDLAAVAEASWATVDAPDATLEVTIDETIQADETYIRHFFRNLFENAITHGSSTVTVSVGRLPTGFYVADDGAGIPAADREAVFEAGFTTAADQGGTGMGLAFIQELAGVYGWDCTVTESAAGGAQFEFTDVAFDDPAQK